MIGLRCKKRIIKHISGKYVSFVIRSGLCPADKDEDCTRHRRGHFGSKLMNKKQIMFAKRVKNRPGMFYVLYKK